MQAKQQIDKKAIRQRADGERQKVLRLYIRSGLMPPDVAALYKRWKKDKPVQVENYVLESTYTALKTADPAALDALENALRAGLSALEIYNQEAGTGNTAAATRSAAAALWMAQKGLF